MLLREELQRFVRDWRSDLPGDWDRALGDVEPSFEAVNPELLFNSQQPVFPARRASQLPQARADAHVFRAFDELQPSDVRCVLLGQDPYPRISRATGRSFEQGDAPDWLSTSIATSMRALVPMLAECRTGSEIFRRANGFERAVASADVDLEPPQVLFDRWQEAGVLCLNAALTLTRYVPGGAPEQLDGHIPFWAPVIERILRHLAARENGAIVFLLLGQPAQRLSDATGVRTAAEASGTWGRTVDEVRLPHPVAPRFTTGLNPFIEVNKGLERMGAQSIPW